MKKREPGEMETCFCGRKIKNGRCVPCNATFLSAHKMLLTEKRSEEERKAINKIERKQNVGKVETESLRKDFPSSRGSTIDRYFMRKKK